MKFYLIVAKGKKQGMPIAVDVDLFLMGSDKACQLRAEHERIGERHCALVTRDKRVFISDLDGGHPTVVNGETMESGSELPLRSGDMIEAGPLKFMFQLSDKHVPPHKIEEWAMNCLEEATKPPEEVVSRKSENDEFHSEAYLKAASMASSILDGLTAHKGVVKGHLAIAKEEKMTIVRVNEAYLVEEAELASINKELREALKDGNTRVLLDMKNVRRMSSKAVEMFAELRNWLKSYGSKLAMCRIRPEFATMLSNYPTTHDMHIFEDKYKARETKW